MLRSTGRGVQFTTWQPMINLPDHWFLRVWNLAYHHPRSITVAPRLHYHLILLLPSPMYQFDCLSFSKKAWKRGLQGTHQWTIRLEFQKWIHQPCIHWIVTAVAATVHLSMIQSSWSVVDSSDVHQDLDVTKSRFCWLPSDASTFQWKDVPCSSDPMIQRKVHTPPFFV